ncbi:hypothetical protein [Thiorhodococcus drewsii]|nr:hypothetical protein [Thiorhodococcus drewsii]
MIERDRSGVSTTAMKKIAVILLAVSSVAFGSPIPLLTSAPTNSASQMQRTQQPVQTEESYITRSGAVQLDANALLPVSSINGQRIASQSVYTEQLISLEFFSGEETTVIVSSESRPTPESISLIGRLPNRKFASFSMVVDPIHYMISLQNPESDTLFRVVGDTESGAGQVFEIDLKQMTDVQHLPPLVPPTD